MNRKTVCLVGLVLVFLPVLPARGQAPTEPKEDPRPVDGQDILRRLVRVPIFQWGVKGREPAISHIGPTAQEFYAAFGLGEGDKPISAMDLDGVALASVQALYRMSLELEKKTAELEAKAKTIEELTQRIEALERQVKDLQTLWSWPTKDLQTPWSWPPK